MGDAKGEEAKQSEKLKPGEKPAAHTEHVNIIEGIHAPGQTGGSNPWQQGGESISQEQATKIYQDAQGKEQMDVPPVFPPTGDAKPFSVADMFNDALKEAFVGEALKDLPQEQQEDVREGLKIFEGRDPEKIGKFLENATSAEREAFYKCLEAEGYKVERTRQPNPAPLGGPEHVDIRITKPGSNVPTGITIHETHTTHAGDNNYSANVGLERQFP